MIFAFDIDGTLTPARQSMLPEHKDRLLRFMRRNNHAPFYLITGSDLAKVQEQMPWDILRWFTGVFTCMGNELWEPKWSPPEEPKFILKYSNDYSFPTELVNKLESLLEENIYQPKTGNHIEFRTGSINFSIVGRNATNEQREQYLIYDNLTNERKYIVNELQSMFPCYDISAGGQISIDITQRGHNKAQTLKYFRGAFGGLNSKTPICFFGDKMTGNGNDLPLAIALKNEKISDDIQNQWHEVKGPEDVLKILGA